MSKDKDITQIVDGQFFVPASPTLKHQMIAGNIFFLFKTVIEEIGGLSFVPLTEVFLDDDNVYKPDVVYIAPANVAIAQLDSMRIKGAPDLVVEVLSPSTAKFDRQEKYINYEKHGVKEYWIVDSLHETIEIWNLNQNGKFDYKGAFSDNDNFDSVVLKQKVSIQDLWRWQ